MTSDARRLVQRYLHDLSVSLDEHPDRDEIVADVSTHIEDELALLGPSPSETEVAEVLTALGPVREIVGESGVTTPGRFRWLPWLVAVVLAVGMAGVGIAPFAGAVWIPTWLLLLAGLVVLCVSDEWTTAEKITGIVAVMAVSGGLRLLVLAISPTDVASPPAVLAALATAIGMAVAIAVRPWRQLFRSTERTSS